MEYLQRRRALLSSFGMKSLLWSKGLCGFMLGCCILLKGQKGQGILQYSPCIMLAKPELEVCFFISENNALDLSSSRILSFGLYQKYTTSSISAFNQLLRTRQSPFSAVQTSRSHVGSKQLKSKHFAGLTDQTKFFSNHSSHCSLVKLLEMLASTTPCEIISV